MPTFSLAGARDDACNARCWSLRTVVQMRSWTLIQLTSPELPVSTTTACQPSGAGKTTRSGFRMSGATPWLLLPPAVSTQESMISTCGSQPTKGHANSVVSHERAANSSSSTRPGSCRCQPRASGLMETFMTRREKFWSSHREPRLTVRHMMPPRSATSAVNMRRTQGVHLGCELFTLSIIAMGPVASPTAKLIGTDQSAVSARPTGRNCIVSEDLPEEALASARHRRKLPDCDACKVSAVCGSPVARTVNASSVSWLYTITWGSAEITWHGMPNVNLVLTASAWRQTCTGYPVNSVLEVAGKALVRVACVKPPLLSGSFAGAKADQPPPSLLRTAR
mmetsp:Transcript_26961/g.85680  ORF Transcript_26961/g.85680 Transcript_26961/m.85680 type:complete len:337 (+) Transcript_26961:1398-2408(+)